MDSRRRPGARDNKRRAGRARPAPRRREKETVNHPAHYGGKDNPYEVVKVVEAWGLDRDAYLFNVVKYIGRSGRKEGTPPIEDLKKAAWYLNRRIENMARKNVTSRQFWRNR